MYSISHARSAQPVVGWRGWLLLTGWALFGNLPTGELAAATGAVTGKIQFNRDVRPIFSDTCFRCHGPDAKARKGNLRLDVRDDAVRTRDGKTPIVPGNAAQSEAYRRLTTSDADDLMPPPSIHKALTAQQIDIIRRWIDQGAEYQAHWAYAPLGHPAPSPAEARSKSSGKNPIDGFIRARLAQEGLAPSKAAEPTTLFRRLHLDLTGLPPKPEDLTRFLSDRGEDAYVRWVEQLLASSQFSERMTVWWLDLVRYADSVGYHSDVPMPVWPYRDYVIRSFRENKPFDRFTVEQLAGDLLPEATQEQKVASTYNRLLQTTEEGGAQAKEYEFIYACDRVRNTASTWLGATLLCAQCHDHKYDPYTMKDFYSFAAFFTDIQEPIVGSRGRGTLLPDAAQERQLAEFEAAIKRRREVLDTPTPELAAQQQTWEQEMGRAPEWRAVGVKTVASTSGAKLEIQDGGVIKVKGPFPEKDHFTFTSVLEPGEVTGLRLEVLSDPDLPASGPGTASNGNFVLNEFGLKEGGEFGTNRVLALSRAAVDFSQDGYSADRLIDGKLDSAGWAVLPQIGKDHYAVFELSEPLRVTTPTVIRVKLSFQSQFGQHLIGKCRLAVTSSRAPSRTLGMPEAIRKVMAVATAERTDAQRQELAKYYRSIAPTLDADRKELAKLEEQKRTFTAAIPSCLVTVSGAPREMKIHPRGNWMADTGPAVVPAVPEVLGRVSTSGRATRLDLARWMVAPDNGLTARVFVNRVWRLFFGTGLSKTLYDSGSQGELPTHPELLEWMAADFVQSGWDVRHLIRLMVTSATYRQTSVASKELSEQDPYNRLYARQSPFRLEAEFIRDSVLAVSGLLVDRVGGPSVFPYQPAGYWGALNFPTREWQNSKGEGLYRRGLYTHWQRTFLHPSLAAFDACSREEATAERSRSNIPQQALALLNDPAYVEAARSLAIRLLRDPAGSPRRRLEATFLRVLGRPIRRDEAKALLELQQKHLAEFRARPEDARKLVAVGELPTPSELDPIEVASWMSVGRTLLNLHETITRE